MSERVPCAKCGALILPFTATETGGICIPCQRGYRSQIETSRLRRIEEKKYEQSPARKHWVWLVEHVHGAPDGYETLSDADQAYFALGLLEGDVYNGGFEQYFFNSSADYYPRAVSVLMELGATNALRLVLAAREALFGSLPLPTSTQARRALLRSNHDTESREKKLHVIDAEFWEDADELHKKMESFAERHGLRRSF